MKPKDVTLFIYDEPANFNLESTKLRLGKSVFKAVKLIQSKDEFSIELNKLDDQEPFVLICHVFHREDEAGIKHKGYLNFRGEGIEEEFKIEAILVSSGDSGEVAKSIHQVENENKGVFDYSDIMNNIKLDKIRTYSKKNVFDSVKNLSVEKKDYPLAEFGIITALYKDEFEEVKKHFIWNDSESIIVGNKKYWFGHLVDFPERKVVAAIPSATGMVDSAIIATQMLELFKPKYLLMSGVCGGKEDTDFGDIVLASKVFTFQKGKVSDLKNKNGDKIELFDKEAKKIDYDQLYDENGKQIKVIVEKFEIEHDSMLEFKLKDFVEPELDRIVSEINEHISGNGHKQKIKIHFDGIACSTMVINKDGFFEDNIKVIDRKTVAVEMESYGVARACEFGNEGKTKWIIFKSIMDNMKDKDDTAKKFAAYTSGLFLKHLIYDGILK